MAAVVNSAQGRVGSAPLQMIELHPFPPASLQDIELEPSSAARPRASSACSSIVRANMLFRWEAALRLEDTASIDADLAKVVETRSVAHPAGFGKIAKGKIVGSAWRTSLMRARRALL